MSTTNQNVKETAREDGQVYKNAIKQLTQKWSDEFDDLRDKYLWCEEFKFKVEALLKYELKEQLRQKISELRDIIKNIESSQENKDIDVRYYAWLSTSREKDCYREGALYAGKIKDVPDKYKPLSGDSKGRKYCVITKAQQKNKNIKE